MVKTMTKKCLLIETKDKRKFFTEEKNLKQLTEFSKTFDVKMSLVETEEGNILKLEDLAVAICDSIYEKKEEKYQIVKEISRETIRNRAEKISAYILKRFEKNQIVSLSDLREKFKEYNLTSAALCNHISRIKNELEQEGIKFTKVGAGKYKVA